MRNIRLDVCYDGTRYSGWQRQTSHDNTIQGKLETALSRILSEPIEISASGRTDTGVHAIGQVVNFHTDAAMDCTELLAQLRRYLPEDIGIYSCREVSPRFHARLNALEKTYRYRVWNSELPCVFERRYVAEMPEKLDVEAMHEAAQLFLGTHDFSAFCANRKMKKSTVRTIKAFSVERVGEEIHFTVTGNGFLHNMVRILVGTLIEVGRGEREMDSIPMLFGAKREQAGFLAPGKGLCLMEVRY
ncbi:MAG: tRNA pseudouridine(38-40) synthase TruA [Oscillospiraceae bacterium]|nr:tRNA pseudouridine(38-40) synthase TruA [Oscillospiraceae bacterium]